MTRPHTIAHWLTGEPEAERTADSQDIRDWLLNRADPYSKSAALFAFGMTVFTAGVAIFGIALSVML